MTWQIPFNRATLAGDEFTYMRQAVEQGHISGDGPFTQRSEALLEDALGAERVLLTTSCTHALELAALLLDVGPDAEVVVPSFTFSSTASAFALRGARIVFADIRPDTLNLDDERLAEVVSRRTRAIVPVHYGGVACELDPILQLADDAGASVVEDNAHGLLGTYRGRPLGTFGPFAALSFHETKNLTCGEGGALVLNEGAYVERAEIMREKGTDRKRFFRGEIDRYTWVDHGSSYLLSDALAAFLVAQIEARERIQAARRTIWERYYRRLASWAERIGARLPVVPSHCGQAYHLFYVLMPSTEQRAGLIEHLGRRSILAVFHYLPLHLSKMGRRLGGRPGQCPVAEDVSERLVRLPFFTGLSEEDQEQVIAAVEEFA